MIVTKVKGENIESVYSGAQQPQSMQQETLGAQQPQAYGNDEIVTLIYIGGSKQYL